MQEAAAGCSACSFTRKAPPMEFARVAYMEKAAARRGYRVLISQCDGTQENIRFCLDNFASHGLDGAILLSNSFPNLNAWIVEYAKQLQHVVYYDRPLHDDGSCDYVEVDLAAGLRQLVDHLVETGRRRIAYFLPYSGFPCGKYPSMLARESGFTRGWRRTACLSIRNSQPGFSSTSSPVSRNWSNAS
ncbi:MAG: hypothetical protein L6W00_02945 [Lentisphaeria bacterium]|nr:MAG: hypothetical protein L6W00_02945 [Lentisphaeria bacterium]